MTPVAERLFRSPALLSLTFAMFGMAFPILATWLSLPEPHQSVGLWSIIALHSGSALLIIIDTLPLILAVSVWIVAKRSTAAHAHMRELRRYAESTGHNLHQIIETCVDAVITTGAGGTIENWNSAAEAMFGHARDAVLGKPLNIIDPPESRTGARSTLSQASREQERSIVESEFVTKDGRRFTASSSLGVLRSDNGQPTGLLAIVRDVTQRRQIERALVEARDAAESANEAKSRFLANMSHEIRTPMNGIIGMTQILLETELDERQKDCLETLSASTEQLGFVINDILDISRLEANKLEIKKEPVDVERLVRTTADMFRASAESKGIDLVVRVADNVPFSIIGDYHRIKQILTNLISNAVKFTDEGSITVRSHIERETTQDIVVAFEVSDTGVGMSSAQCRRIFLPFTQVDDSSTRAATGTGLGLSICKQLVERMDGEIEVQSQAGIGSTFRFAIPTNQSELGAEIVDEVLDAMDSDIAGAEVLLVDDDTVNRKVASALLTSLKCRVDIARNGREAIDASATKPYDAVLMDVQMPVMDGITATAAIRGSGAHPDVPIIAMTARAMHGDREDFLGAGMDDHLPKPISKTQLRNLIAFWRGRRSDKTAGSGTPGKTLRRPPGESTETNSAEAGAQVDASVSALDGGRLDDLLAAMGDVGPDVLRDVIGEFLNAMPQECAALCAAAESGDARRVRVVAHRMRSGAGNLGIESMYEQCSALEELARAGDIGEAVERAAAIRKEFEQARSAIEHWVGAKLNPGPVDESAA